MDRILHAVSLPLPPLPMSLAQERCRMDPDDPDAYDIHVFHPELALLPTSETSEDEDADAPEASRAQGCSGIEISSHTACHTYHGSSRCVENGYDGPYDGKCAICLDNYQDGDSVRALRCLHMFHTACVDRWLAGNRLCPLCKQDMTGTGGNAESIDSSAHTALRARGEPLGFPGSQQGPRAFVCNARCYNGRSYVQRPLSRLTRSAALLQIVALQPTQPFQSGRTPCIIAL